MIAVRLFWREEVQERLDEFGCVLIDEQNDPSEYQSSYWRTEWGFHFYIPEIGPDRLCPEHRLYAILAELAELAPKKD